MTYQWNFFSASLDPVQGSEQAGKRPVLVVSRERINQILPIINVIPITSVKSPNRVIYPNEVLLPLGVDGLTANSVALCYQVRTLDKTRLEKHLGELADVTLKMQIQNALRFQLEL
jgi:mRNA interferase MazF